MTAAKKKLPPVSGLPDDQLLCRRGGLLHSWQPNPTARLERSVMASVASYVVPERCDRCGNEKFIYLDSAKRRIGNPYYRPAPGHTKVRRASAAEVEAEIFNRSLLLQQIDPDTGEIFRPSRRSDRKPAARTRRRNAA